MSSPATFSVILFTVPPSGHANTTSGAMVRVDGRETLLRTIELFLNRDEVESICVVFDQGAVDEARSKFGGHFGFSGVKLVTGGPRWIDQLIAARSKISPIATNILIHDAARPAVPYTDVDALSELAKKHEAIVTTSSVDADLIELDEGGHPLAALNGECYLKLMTPMIFSRAVFEQIVERKSLPHASTLSLAPGSPLNMRVNRADDAPLAMALIGLLLKPKAKASSPFEEAQW